MSAADAANAARAALATIAALIAANPFPGLRSFKPSESDRFFGRQAQIDALVVRLAEVPLLAVSGASGCGKSSLVLAGLLNELKRRHQADDDTDWRPVVMRPGNRPIANLADALAAALGAGTHVDGRPADPDGDGDGPLARRSASLYGQLRLGGLALVEVVRLARLAPGVRVLVVVDQFEEIFRFKRMADPDEASAFVKLLLQAAADPASPVSVVLTLRSDTLGGCADFPDLPEAVSRGSTLVPRLSRSQRKEAIVRPIALRGAQIAPRLVQRLLSDVSDDFDDLPVMQHALSRTWQHWAESCGGSRAIDLDDYDAIGGAAGALSRHANEARLSLGALGGASGGAGPDDRGAVVERVFRALTERVAAGTEVRRPLDFNQLCAVCGGSSPQATADVTQVVERYRRADTAFLVPGAEVALSGNPVIDISHESLIRQWQQLRNWVRDETEAEAELRRLIDDARKHAEADGELWRGRNLERARDWQRRNQPNAAWVRLCTGSSAEQGQADFDAVQTFLDKSSAAEQAERRRARLQRGGLVTLGVLVVVGSVVAAVTGLSLQRRALSGELAARSILALGQDPARSARLALMALDQNPDNPRGEYALRQAMANLEVARTELIVDFPEPITEARYTADFERLVVAGGKTIRLLRADDLKTLRELQAPAAVDKAWLMGEQVVTSTTDGKVVLLAPDGKPVADLSCQDPRNLAMRVAYSAASAARPAQLAVGCNRGELALWDLTPGGAPVRHALLPGQADRPAISALGFSADGNYLASGDGRGNGLVWKHGVDDRPWIGELQAGKSGLRHDGAIRDIGFSPTEPRLLATASDDGNSRVWTLDLAQGRLEVGSDARLNLAHERPVTIARFVDRADDPNRLMTVSDRRVYFWSDANTHDERRHDDWVSEASVSKDGELLVSASQDGTARVWSSRTTVPVAVLRGHRNEVTHALFGPAGRIITSSRDRTLRAWRLNAPTLLAAGRPWQSSVALPSDGQGALLCGEQGPDGEVCAWSVLQGGLAQTGSAADGSSASARRHFGPAAAAGKPRPAGDKSPAAAPFLITTDAISLSSDGRMMLANRLTYDVYGEYSPTLWNLNASGGQITPDWLARGRYAVFNPARAELAVLGDKRDVAVWPQAALMQAGAGPAGNPLLSLAAQPDRYGISLSPDGRWLATLEGKRTMLWDRQAPAAPARELKGHKGDIRGLVFSADSSALVTASADRTARVWTVKGLAAGQMPPSVELAGGHSAALSSASFSPDGKRVVTASADNSVRVWDAASGRELAALYHHAGKVNDAVFDASGERIVSASDDGTAMVSRCDACRLPLADLVARARLIVRLTDDEEQRLRSEQQARSAFLTLPRWLGGGR